MGDTTYLAGSVGAFRIITYDPSTQKPVGGVPVKIYMEKEGKNSSKESSEANSSLKDKVESYGEKVFSGKTDITGSLNASFPISEDREGRVKVTIVTGLEGKTNNVVANINIRKKFKIYLSTDKPIYKPGQTIHMRALALKVPSLKPVANEDMIFEVQDGKGNKIFKKKVKTSSFGVAHAELKLADEVNLGAFPISVTLLNERAEKTVTVKKYVLPKFKISFKKDRKFYMPGDTLKGDVNVKYFFGKPVSGGKVKVTLYTFDVEFRPVTELTGRTDAKGNYSFTMKLPDYLVGQPLEKGGAVVKLDVEVVDKAEHKEKLVRMIPVSKEALKIQLIPESGVLKKGIENVVYVLASYPDGSPAKVGLSLQVKDNPPQVVSTDEAGVAEFTVKPKNKGAFFVKVNGVTPQGEKIKTTVELYVGGKKDDFILRTDKPSYKVGDRINIEIISTVPRRTYYIDFVKDNQLILTKAVEAEGVRQKYSVDVTPDMKGIVTVRAYTFTRDNNIIRDTKKIIVKSNKTLVILVDPDKKVYKPGEDAKIRFTVTDSSGNPTASAMNVNIVDEAVFAMGEMNPGFEKVYFMLEKELLNPKYEIHGFTLKDVLIQRDQIVKDKEILERVLLTKLPTPSKGGLKIDTFTNKLKKCYQQLMKLEPIVVARYRKTKKWEGTDVLDILVKEGKLKNEDIIDPWGHKFFLIYDKRLNRPVVVSAGPNGKIDGTDDLTLNVFESKYWNQVSNWLPRDKVVRMFKAKEGFMEDEKGAVPSVLPVPSAPRNGGGGKKIRVRQYFPETLYTNPEVITNEKGKAEISLKMADSITTWRLTAFANAINGLMGDVVAPIKVFQDFFIDIDFPVSLTCGDQVSVPIAVYNYLKEPQKVKLTVDTKGQDWFVLKDKPVKYISLKAGDVGVVYFTIVTKKIGKYKFTVYGEGTKFSDAIRREIEVVPDGKVHYWTKSDRLSGDTKVVVNIPSAAIKGASKILVSVYPGVVSQVVEGLDKIFRMPYGCFEQTTATTYPNVLVLDYLKRTKKITPELQMKAEGYINTGYQRLVSFEVQGGGFSWFGEPPANQCLTALGIMEFRDMQKVRYVDDALIDRTQRWLASQQKQDGSWEPDKNYLHANTWRKIQGGGKIPVTAYIVWALAESGYRGDDLKKGIAFLKKNANKVQDAYSLALVCNALVDLEPNGQLTKEMLNRLKKKAHINKDEAWWNAEIQTATFSKGKGADIETTSLAAMCFLKAKGYEDIAQKAVNHIIKSKDSFGTWYSTQSTVLAMKALILAQEKATSDIDAKVIITVNGKRKEEFVVNKENYDVFKQADFGDVTLDGKNIVKISLQGKGKCYYQVSAKYYLPWKMEKQGKKPLTITVGYDRTHLKSDDIITSNITITNNTKATMKMVMVDLGIPPGFTPLTTDLQQYVGKKFAKFNTTSRQIIIYIETLKPHEKLSFSYRLKAKYPLKVKTPKSRVYQYYDPKVEDFAKPVTLEVKK